MIGGRLIKRDSEKFLKRYPVVDLCFQFGVGVDAEPLLEEQTFQKQKRRIGLISFAAFSDGVISDQDAINARPIDNGIDLLHSYDGAVTFDGAEKCDVGKGKIGFHFLEAHSSSRLIDLQELWQKK